MSVRAPGFASALSLRSSVRTPFAGWVLSACASHGCAGPDAAALSADAAGAGFRASLPEGGRCGPEVVPADPASAMSASAGDADAGSPGCRGGASADGGATEYSPIRPLGIGYPDGPNLLPRHVAYLTFDDGPSEWTNDFLDILRLKGVHATFFITARQLKGPAGLDGTYVDDRGATVVFRDLLKREEDEGHVLADHTVNHPDLAAITPVQIRSEIEEDELLINLALVRAGGKPQVLSLFRPPYGSPWYSGVIGTSLPLPSQRISSHGVNVMWTVSATDAVDWAQGESFSRTHKPSLGPDAPTYEAKMARIKQTVLSSPQIANGDGMIILMHDTHDTTRDVLIDIIDALAAAGYSFDTIEDYVAWRWNRPSIDLTPGPALYQACVEERNWGCSSFGVPVGTDRAHEVCGRFWLAYQALGGVAVLGAPVSAPTLAPLTGIWSQAFEHAVVELHPESPAPCNVVAIPR